jgi:putative Mg2+ transporter-C (MgtC) family protein
VEAVLVDLGASTAEWPLAGTVGLRLLAAIVLAGILGFERERHRHSAGVRTHMLVALGTTLFTAVTVLADGHGQVGNIVRGIAPGIGFLGGGAILKSANQPEEIKGMTTAASIWVTAALGVAVGAGWIASAAVAVVLSVLILSGIGWLEARFEKKL